MTGRPPLRSASLVGGTIAAGLTLRLVRLGLPSGVVKYGGSVLWAAMIYWLVSTARPRWRPAPAAALAMAVATAVELFKLARAPGLDAFRATLAGRLLLGAVFSGWDLVAYALAIAAAAAFEPATRRR